MAGLVGRDLGRYHLVEQLGEGGMAAVYKAFDKRLERYVAVKVIIAQGNQEKFLKRFEREAKALAKLSHANIVNVHDYGEDAGIPYLVMEYIPGGTLKSKMGSSMHYMEAARILSPVARALEYAHKLHIIHRDVKPANILLTESGEPMLSDFGIAKMIESADSDLTGTGVGIGTPEYMAPEQGQGLPVDRRADIYALGIVFYELVTGRKPFRADTPMAVLVKHISEPLPRPSSFIPSLPADVENIIFKAMAKKPEDRYQDMGELAIALENLYQKAITQEPEAQETARMTMPPPPPPPPPPGFIPAPAGGGDSTGSGATGLTGGGSQEFNWAAGGGRQTSASREFSTVGRTGNFSDVANAEPATTRPWVIWAAIGGILILGLCAALTLGAGGLMVLLGPSVTSTPEWVVDVTEPPLEEPSEMPPEDETAWVEEVTPELPTPEVLYEPPHIATKEEAEKAANSGVKSLGDLAPEKYSDTELNQIGAVLPYTVTLKKSEPALVWNGWCATNKDILKENLKHIKFGFEMDGAAVDPALLSTRNYKSSDNKWDCYGEFFLVDAWPPGNYRVVMVTTLEWALNDGKQDFKAGTMTTEYMVTVNGP